MVAVGGQVKREGESFEERLDRLYPGGPLPEGYTFVDTGESND